MRQDRKEVARRFQQGRLDAAKTALAASYGTAGIGLGVDSFTGEPGEGVTAGELGTNALLGTMPVLGAATGYVIGGGSAKQEGLERQAKIKARNPESLEGEFKQKADLLNNRDRTRSRMQTRSARGAAIGAAAMLVPTLMAAETINSLLISPLHLCNHV